jgi:flagellar biosynthesis/type III secretory pathway ATPase
VDAAIALRPEMLAFLQQRPDEGTTYDQTRQQLLGLAHRLQQHQAGRAGASA